MLYKKFQAVAQIVGIATIGLLAVYGLVTILGGDLVAWASGRAAPAATDVPSVMNYQGYLRDDEGNLLNGYYTMTFAIYTTTLGGTPLWSEDLTSVTVRDGYFNVLLGDTNPFLTNLFTDPDRYIGVTVAPYAEMVPRQRFASVPYAFRADQAAQADQALQADQADQASQADRAYGLSAPDDDPYDALYVDNEGRIGIDTTDTSNSTLHVEGQDNDGTGAALKISSSQTQYMLLDDNEIDASLPSDDNKLYLNHNSTGTVEVGHGLVVDGNADVNGDVNVNGVAPVLIKRFENQGDEANFDTGISADDYYCVATGWSAHYDIQESGTGLNMVWTYVSGGTWWAKCAFLSHNNHEDPDVDVVCFRKEIADWQGASTSLHDPD